MVCNIGNGNTHYRWLARTPFFFLYTLAFSRSQLLQTATRCCCCCCCNIPSFTDHNFFGEIFNCVNYWLAPVWLQLREMHGVFFFHLLLRFTLPHAVWFRFRSYFVNWQNFVCDESMVSKWLRFVNAFGMIRQKLLIAVGWFDDCRWWRWRRWEFFFSLSPFLLEILDLCTLKKTRQLFISGCFFFFLISDGFRADGKCLFPALIGFELCIIFLFFFTLWSVR